MFTPTTLSQLFCPQADGEGEELSQWSVAAQRAPGHTLVYYESMLFEFHGVRGTRKKPGKAGEGAGNKHQV